MPVPYCRAGRPWSSPESPSVAGHLFTDINEEQSARGIGGTPAEDQPLHTSSGLEMEEKPWTVNGPAAWPKAWGTRKRPPMGRSKIGREKKAVWPKFLGWLPRDLVAGKGRRRQGHKSCWAPQGTATRQATTFALPGLCLFIFAPGLLQLVPRFMLALPVQDPVHQLPAAGQGRRSPARKERV